MAPPLQPQAAGVEVAQHKRFAWLLAGGLAGATLGGGAVLASQSVMVTDELSATEQERDEGYFALGPEVMLAVKPGSSMHHWLRGRTGTRVRLVIESESASDE